MSLSKLTGWGTALLAAQKEVAYRSVAGAAAGANIAVADLTVSKPLVCVYNATDKAHIDLKLVTVTAGNIAIAGINTTGKTLVIGFGNV